MGDNVDRPTVSEALIALRIGNTAGVPIGQGLQAFTLDGREFPDYVIAVRQIYLIQPCSRALPASPCRKSNRLPADGINPVTLSCAADIAYPYRLSYHSMLMALKSVFQRCSSIICGQTVGFSRP